MTDDREVLTWTEFGSASRELAGTIVGSEFEAEVVVAIARGGLVLAGALAYALGLKNCGAVNAEFYTGIGERLAEPVLLPPFLEAGSVEGKRVLLVDDVSDSGRTLAMVVTLIEAMGAEVRTAVLYTKPGTVHEPAYSWKRTDRWITFPWSALPPVGSEVEAP